MRKWLDPQTPRLRAHRLQLPPPHSLEVLQLLRLSAIRRRPQQRLIQHLHPALPRQRQAPRHCHPQLQQPLLPFLQLREPHPLFLSQQLQAPRRFFLLYRHLQEQLLPLLLLQQIEEHFLLYHLQPVDFLLPEPMLRFQRQRRQPLSLEHPRRQSHPALRQLQQRRHPRLSLEHQIQQPRRPRHL